MIRFKKASFKVLWRIIDTQKPGKPVSEKNKKSKPPEIKHK